jgi:hypothetical protein
MRGRYCRVEALVPERHARELYRANQLDLHGINWTYLSTDAVQDLDAYLAGAQRISASDDPMFHAIVDESSGLAVGVAAYHLLSSASAHARCHRGHVLDDATCLR